jgi:hypothetical protein
MEKSTRLRPAGYGFLFGLAWRAKRCGSLDGLPNSETSLPRALRAAVNLTDTVRAKPRRKPRGKDPPVGFACRTSPVSLAQSGFWNSCYRRVRSSQESCLVS